MHNQMGGCTNLLQEVDCAFAKAKKVSITSFMGLRIETVFMAITALTKNASHLIPLSLWWWQLTKKLYGEQKYLHGLKKYLHSFKRPVFSHVTRLTVLYRTVLAYKFLRNTVFCFQCCRVNLILSLDVHYVYLRLWVGQGHLLKHFA